MINGTATQYVRIYSVKDGHPYALSQAIEVAAGDEYYVVVEEDGTE